MDPFSLDWLNLALRWAHLVVGIAWIGASFYFVWQDGHLEATADDPEGRRVQGELWMVHGGGFYHVRKFKVAPPEPPSHLHWFKWEAYATWLSGFALLVSSYWVGSAAFLVPPGSGLSHVAGMEIGALSLIVTWVAYDLLCRSPLARDDRLLAAAVAALVALVAFVLAHLLAGRAAFIHAGAALGTVMAANVFMVVIPNQRRMVAALTRGAQPDPEWGRRGKQRSVHNSYLTLPVVFAMISNHYPQIYAHDFNWLIFLALAALGAGVRHVFLLRHRDHARVWMLPAAGLAFVALAVAVTTIRPAPASAPAVVAGDRTDAPFKVVQAIIDVRCTACHAVRPTFDGFDAPPKGVTMETAQDIKHWVAAIHAQAIASETMPLGNVTGMTAEERAILARWIQAGAPVN